MPIARFELEDGRIARFEVPDGTTPEDAQSLIAEHLSANPLPDKAARPLPDGVTPSDAGAGRGSVMPHGPTLRERLFDRNVTTLPGEPVARRGGTRSEGPRPFVGGDEKAVPDDQFSVNGTLYKKPVVSNDVFGPDDGSITRGVDTISPSPEPSALGGAFRALDRKPMDQSLAGTVLENVGDAGRGVAKVVPGLATSLWGGVQAGADVVGADKVAGVAREAAGAGRQYLRQLDNPNGDKLVTGALQSLGTAMAGGAAFGVPGAIGTAVGQTAGDKYSELRSQGLDVDASLEGATVHGIAEFVGERIGMPSLGRLVSGLAQKTGMKPSEVLREALKQQGEEQATLAIQDLYDKFGRGSTRHDMTFDDYVNDVVDTAKQTAIMSAVAGAGGRVARTVAPEPQQRQRVDPPTLVDQAINEAATSVGLGVKAATALRDKIKGLSPAKAVQVVAKAFDGFERAGLTKKPGAKDGFLTTLQQKVDEAAKAADEQPAQDQAGAPPAEGPGVSQAMPAPAPEVAAAEGEDFTGLETPAPTGPIEGEAINRNWSHFSPESGTLAIPREQMPQIKAEHRGALVNFLNARGVEHQEEAVDPASLKPTQAEFSPKKVAQASEYAGGDRAILVSQDGYVVDGHHQWLAARDAGEPIRVIRLGAPINDLLRLAHQFPSSFTAKGPSRAAAGNGTPGPVGTEGAGAAERGVGTGTGEVVPGEQQQPAGPGPAGTPVPDAGLRPEAALPGPAGRDDALKPGQAVTVDGTPYQVVGGGETAVRLKGEDGKVRIISRTSDNWAKIKQKESTHVDAGTAPGAQATADQAGTPARGAAAPAGDARDAGVPATRTPTAEAAGVMPAPAAPESAAATTEGSADASLNASSSEPGAQEGQPRVPAPQPARARSKLPKVAGPKPVMGSEVLGAIVHHLGGIGTALRGDLSRQEARERVNKKSGKKTQYTAWRGDGMLFRKEAPTDLTDIARVLEEAGYLEPGTLERDYLEATSRVQDIIKAEIDKPGSTQHLGAESVDAEMSRRRENAMHEQAQQSHEALDEFLHGELDIEAAGAPSDAETRENGLALAQLLDEAGEAGVDVDALKENFFDAADPEWSQDQYEKQLAEAVLEATARARRQAGGDDAGEARGNDSVRVTAGRNQDGAPGDRANGPEQAVRPEGEEARPGLSLQAESEADAQAKADREAAALAAEQKTREADQARLKKQADDREGRARADQTVDDFQLGQSADQQLSGQGDLLSAAPAPAPKPTPNTIFTDDAAEKARALLRAKLSGGNKQRGGIDPEVFQAGITLAGYHIERGARTFSAYASAMLADLGDVVRPYLKSWYMALKYDPRSAGMEGLDDAATVDRTDVDAIGAQEDNSPQENPGVSDPATDLERDRGNAGTADAPVAGDVSPVAGGTVWVDGKPRSQPGEQGSGRARDAGVPAGGTPAGREPGDQSVHRGERTRQPALFDAGDRDGERSDDPGLAGVQPETVAASQVAGTAAGGLDDAAKRTRQRAADSVAVKPGDLENIRATLPYLKPEQQEDVHKAEQRFAKPDGYGMLFTNGTGTGKTFTGLGIVKRFARQGKSNTLIVVPDMKIMADWVDSGRALGLTITPLENTKDAGKGITITTYANLGDNDELARRDWDLVVPDEAHSLMQSADGAQTKALDALRAITWHPRGAEARFTMLNRADIDARAALGKQIDANDRIRNLDDTMDAHRDALEAENQTLRAKWSVLNKKLEAIKDAMREEWPARQGHARARVAALSATPFAYETTVDWAEGLLFDYAEGYPKEYVNSSRYNTPSPRDYFFMQHFGWHMKNGKLNQPGPKVDRGLMQRQFNAWLKKRSVLSGRQLEVDPDYDRKFILVESAIGNEIDRALEWLSEKSREEDAAERERVKAGAEPSHNGYSFLHGEASEGFYGPLGHLVRRYFLEAIKAKEVIQHVREHLALGRKVVVWHDFKKGGSSNPFDFQPRTAPAPGSNQADVPAAREAYNKAAAEFRREFPLLTGQQMLTDLISPIERFKREFPDVLLINGDEKQADLLARYKRFNDDAVGPVVALVQSAKNKGWSGHDTTGKHQRVQFNLGLPTQPTMTIQQEGRTYRTGQVSNAMFRYLNTGTNWERWAFASTIAERASATENLGSGELARALKDAFIAGFEESGDFRAGHEGEGTGGKERDRAANNAITEFDRAKSFYFGTQKKNSKTKAQEGKDYFATPEPVGLKMVQWLDLRSGEDALEPSAGHGAIARWFAELTKRTAIEPSNALGARLAMVFDGKIVQGDFEGLHVSNKFDGIAMNPPFGVGGKLAIEHLAKAATHVRDGGRIVALIPTGPAADKRFDQWFYEEQTRPIKPLLDHPTLGAIYRGDTVKTRAAWMPEGKVVSQNGGYVMLHKAGTNQDSGVTPQAFTEVQPTGKRTEAYRPAEGLHMVADIKLPQVTFERAGTAVATRIVVLEKPGEGHTAPQQRNMDFSDLKQIGDLFDALEDVGMDPRANPRQQQDEQPAATEVRADDRGDAKQQKAEAKQAGTALAADQGIALVEHTTGKGKVLKGVVRTDLTQTQAKEVDAYTFKKDGGWFIRAEHLPVLMEKFPPAGSGPVLSRGPAFYSDLARQVESSPMNAGTAGAWLQALKGMVSSGKVKADELEWTGVREWLELQQGKVTKQQVSAFLDANGVQVTETVLAEKPAADERAALRQRIDEAGFEIEQDMDGSLVALVRRSDDMLFDYNGKEWVAEEDDVEPMPAGVARDGTRYGAMLEDIANDRDATKYAQYTLPGGENYREILLTLPENQRGEIPPGYTLIDEAEEARADGLAVPAEEVGPWRFRGPSLSSRSYKTRDEALAALLKDAKSEAENGVGIGSYRSGHWDQTNVLAHFRVNDRIDAEGKRVLFVEEIQSDWAQEGKKKGFKQGDRTEGGQLVYDPDERDRVPRAPFVGKTDAWVALAIKRIVKMAVDEGYDRVAFVNGEQSADRYDLSKRVSKAEWTFLPADTLGQLTVWDTEGRHITDRAMKPEELPDHIGKEAADRLLKAPSDNGTRMIDGDGLKVGGEGMRAFYDKIVPAVAKDVVRKLGGGGAATTVNFFPKRVGDATSQPGFDITPAMREKAAAGVPLFKRGASAGFTLDQAKKVAGQLEGMGVRQINVVESVADMPAERRDAILAKDKNGQARGAYFPTEDEVWVVSSNLRNADDMVFVVLHEAFHRGLQVTFGAEGGKLLRQIYATNAKVRALADENIRRWGIGKEEAVNEALADLAGKGEAKHLRGWNRLLKMIRDWLGKIGDALGIHLNYTDEMVESLVAGLTRAGLQDGPSVTLEDGPLRSVPKQTETPAFQRWFGDSKVVDANGEPLVVYHASPNGDIAEFKSSDDGELGPGIYLTGSRDYLRGYTNYITQTSEQPQHAERTATVYPVYVSLRNPLILKGESAQQKFKVQTGGKSSRLMAVLKKIGHDGIVKYDLDGREIEQVVAFRPDQIKSAIGNNGKFDPNESSILLSRGPQHTPEQAAAMAKAGMGGPRTLKGKLQRYYAAAMTTLHDRHALALETRQGLLDQFAGIQNAVQRDVGNLPTEQDPYISVRLANGGTSSVMRALMLHGQARWAANGQHLEKVDGTKGLLDILAPLGEDLNDWFGWMIGNRAARLAAEGRERNLTKDDILALQSLATPANLAKFKQAAVEYAAFKRSVLDVAEAAGLINPDTRKAWDYADYIPFYRQIDERSTFSPTGRKGLAGQSSGIRTLKGGESALNDPMENLLMNFSRLIDASLKNNALRKTIDVLEAADSQAVHKVGYDMTPEILPAEQIRKRLEDAGTPQQVIDVIPPEAFEGMAKMWAIQAPSDPEVVRVMVGGKPQFYRVDDPVLLRSLTSFVPFDFPGLGIMRWFKRLLTSTVTAAPDFVARNFIRDSAASQMITRDGFNPGKSFKGIVSSMRETGGFEVMLFAGASFQSGNINAADPTSTGRAIRRALRRKGISGASADQFLATVLDTPVKFWEKYRHFSEAIENANREAVFEAATNAGKSPTAAAFEAKDLMDFSLRGSWAAYQLLADVVPFLNARVQGLYRLGRTDKRRLVAVGLMMTAASLLLAYANGGDDDYEALPDWDKDTYWHFWIKGEHFRLPKPFELGVAFATIPERVMRYAMGQDSGRKLAGRTWANLRDQLAFDPVPQMIRPVLNVWANKDTFRDAPIENQSDEGKPPHLRFGSSTSPTAREALGLAAPLTDPVGLSPKRLEYLVNAYTGAAGMYALALGDAAVRRILDEAPQPSMRWDDVPVVKAFYRVDPGRSTVWESDLYAMREAADEIHAGVQALKREGALDKAQALEEENLAKLRARTVLDDAGRRLRLLNKRRDMIYGSRTMGKDEKRAQLDEVAKLRAEVARKAVEHPAVKEAF